MISASDNMATDLLIDRLGPGAVERALVGGRPPRPGQHDAVPHRARTVRRRLGQARRARAVEDGVTRRAARSCWNRRIPGRTNPIRIAPTRPPPAYGAEWYGSADGHLPRARRVAGGRRRAGRTGHATSCPRSPASTSTQSKWTYIGAKGGNLPGDLTFSWYAVDRTGQAWVVSFQLNWPRYRSPAAAGWLLSIAKQAFGTASRSVESTRRPQRPRLSAEVQDGTAGRPDVDAPERLRRRIERNQDRRADHRRVGHGDEPAAAAGQRVQPAAHPDDQGRPPTRRRAAPAGFGQPARELGGQHPAENVAAPGAAVQVGQPRCRSAARRPSSSAVWRVRFSGPHSAASTGPRSTVASS